MAGCVPSQAVLHAGAEVVADDAKPGVLRRGDVSGPLGPRGIDLVHHERLAGVEASAQKDSFSVTSTEQIQTDAYVCAEETLLEKGGLTGCLHADEDHGFHSSP